MCFALFRSFGPLDRRCRSALTQAELLPGLGVAVALFHVVQNGGVPLRLWPGHVVDLPGQTVGTLPGVPGLFLFPVELLHKPGVGVPQVCNLRL